MEADNFSEALGLLVSLAVASDFAPVTSEAEPQNWPPVPAVCSFPSRKKEFNESSV
jgi:hypothetical protein